MNFFERSRIPVQLDPSFASLKLGNQVGFYFTL